MLKEPERAVLKKLEEQPDLTDINPKIQLSTSVICFCLAKNQNGQFFKNSKSRPTLIINPKIQLLCFCRAKFVAHRVKF